MRSASLFLLVIALVSFLPRSAGALPTIIISEVAWMGTTLDGGKTSQAAQADEWIEFKNAGLAPVDLAGWVLRSATDDGGPVITLSGSVLFASNRATLLPEAQTRAIFDPNLNRVVWQPGKK